MASWYCSREQVKFAASINGATEDTRIDRIIEAVSRRLERTTRRIFIPKTQTRLYRWPQRDGRGYILYLDFDLISVSTLQTKAQDTSPTTISSSDYFLEPVNYGPPYDRIEIDLSSSAAFESGDTPQRSISVAGSWGYSDDTVTGGIVSSGLSSSSSAVSMVCSNAALIDVGDTLLIESEQIFVSDRTFAARGSILLDDTLTADPADVTVTVDGSHGIVAREVIKIDSEEMFVSSVSTNDLTVIRQYNGSVLAAHSNDAAISINRTLTIERGINGTTAATHADATAINVYEPTFDVVNLCVAESIAMFHQETAGWGRSVGAGDGATEFQGASLAQLRKAVQDYYRPLRLAAV